MKIWLKVLIIVVVIIVAIAITAGLYFAAIVGVNSSRMKKYKVHELDVGSHGDRIHFIPVGHTDAILIESNGRYGLVDGAEDSDNPRNFSGLELQGYEDVVIEYLKKYAGDENGKVTLDFIIGTHAHSDHIGGFDTIMDSPDITVNRAYLKRYYPDRIIQYELDKWDNEEVYNQMVEATERNGVELIQDLVDLSFIHGNFKITLYNGEEAEAGKKVGENENSLGVMVEKGAKKIFLAGDMNNLDGDEKRLAPIIGKVDILKLGHHGLPGSTSFGFLSGLKPDLAICTSDSAMSFATVQKIVLTSKAPTFNTGDAEYSVIDLTSDEIKLYYKR